MAITLVVIGGYSIGGQFVNGYQWLLMVIVLMVMGGYFINGYWWILVVIGGY